MAIVTVRYKRNDKNKSNFAGMIEEGDKHLVKLFDIDETTDNRIIIKGLAQILKFVSNDSVAKVYVQTNVGFYYLEEVIKGECSKVENWGNKDVGEKLAEVVQQKNIKISFSKYKYNENIKELKELDDLCEKSKEQFLSKSSTDKEELKSNHKIYNENTVAITDIELIVRGYSNNASDSRPGMYMCILKYKNNEKLIKAKMDHSTVYQCMITGIIEAVKMLKRPCNIKLYTHTNIGLVKYIKNMEGPNVELLDELFDLLHKGNHSLEEFIGQYRQKELAEKMRGYI